MGVYIDGGNFDFKIVEANIPTAFEATRQLLESGGYSVWSDDDWKKETDPAKALVAIFSAAGWGATFDEDEKEFSIEEAPDSYSEKDKTFFDTMAPYVKRGSYIDIDTSDFQHFEWYFDGYTCIRKEGTMDYDSNIEIVNALLTNREQLPTLIGIHPELDKRIAEVLKG